MKSKKWRPKKNSTAVQLNIAWIIAQGHLPIPGTKRVKYLEENIDATNVVLAQDDLDRLEAIIPLGTVTGGKI